MNDVIKISTFDYDLDMEDLNEFFCCLLAVCLQGSKIDRHSLQDHLQEALSFAKQKLSCQKTVLIYCSTGTVVYHSLFREVCKCISNLAFFPWI